MKFLNCLHLPSVSIATLHSSSLQVLDEGTWLQSWATSLGFKPKAMLTPSKSTPTLLLQQKRPVGKQPCLSPISKLTMNVSVTADLPGYLNVPYTLHKEIIISLSFNSMHWLWCDHVSLYWLQIKNSSGSLSYSLPFKYLPLTWSLTHAEPPGSSAVQWAPSWGLGDRASESISPASKQQTPGSSLHRCRCPGLFTEHVSPFQGGL